MSVFIPNKFPQLQAIICHFQCSPFWLYSLLGKWYELESPTNVYYLSFLTYVLFKHQVYVFFVERSYMKSNPEGGCAESASELVIVLLSLLLDHVKSQKYLFNPIISAISHLDKMKTWGKQIRVTLSKHQTVQLPKEGQPDAGLTKDYSNSPLHRFKKPGSKNYQVCLWIKGWNWFFHIPPYMSYLYIWNYYIFLWYHFNLCDIAGVIFKEYNYNLKTYCIYFKLKCFYCWELREREWWWW